MANSQLEQLLGNNEQYANGGALHRPVHPGKQPIRPASTLRCSHAWTHGSASKTCSGCRPAHHSQCRRRRR